MFPSILLGALYPIGGLEVTFKTLDEFEKIKEWALELQHIHFFVT